MRTVITFMALCSMTAAGPVPAAQRPPAADVLVVLPANNPVPTSFATLKGATYRFTVSGFYLYDGRFGRADCGHRDPADHTPWIAEPNFTVDGRSAECVFLPFSNTHTYEWTLSGTGSPFVVDIPDGAYNTDDDLGPLVVSVVELA
jgi:hypothetical protein